MRKGLGFTGKAPPGLLCSEWNSITASCVTLSPLEEAGWWGWIGCEGVGMYRI